MKYLVVLQVGSVQTILFQLFCNIVIASKKGKTSVCVASNQRWAQRDGSVPLQVFGPILTAPNVSQNVLKVTEVDMLPGMKNRKKKRWKACVFQCCRQTKRADHGGQLWRPNPGDLSDAASTPSAPLHKITRRNKAGQEILPHSRLHMKYRATRRSRPSSASFSRGMSSLDICAKLSFFPLLPNPRCVCMLFFRHLLCWFLRVTHTIRL